MKSTMEIVCATDANYVPHLGVLLRSIESTNRNEPVRVHVLHDQVSDELKKLVQTCAPTFQIEWYGITDHKALDFPPLLQITRATYLRLTIDEVLPKDLKRVLYLDVDMVVNGSLRPMWETDLQGNVCGAVMDPGVVINEFAEKYNLPLPGRYFNAGVILFDFDKLREGQHLEATIKMLSEENAAFKYADQDVLNIVLWNKWLPLDPNWNLQRKFMKNDYEVWKQLVSERKPNPVIVHFTEQAKPWRREDRHVYAWLYLKNLNNTPFKEKIRESGRLDREVALKWQVRYVLRNFPLLKYFRNPWEL